MFKIRYLLRDLYSYIFRYLPWVIIGFLLTFIIPGCEVLALETTYKPGYTVPLGIRQASLISATEFNKSSYGNIDTSDSQWPAYVKALYNGGGYTYETYGTFITFCPNEGFINNHTYTLRFITSTAAGSYANNQYYKFGTAWNQPIKLVNNIGSNPITSGLYVKSLSTNSIQYTDVLTQDFSYISQLTATFTATSQNQCISINIDMNGNFNNQILYFLGYILIDSGIDNSQQLNDINNSVNDVNDSVNDLNDSITSSAVDTGALDDTQVNNDNGVLSAILTLPIDFFRSLINGLSGYDSCPNLEFTLPFVDYPVTLPCVRTLIDSLGATAFWESIGLLAGGLTMFYYLIHLGKELSDMMTLKETRAEWGGL